MIRILRYVALAEAISFLALLVATYIKYTNDSPMGVQILGPVHGTLFLAYVSIALMVRNVGATGRPLVCSLAQSCHSVDSSLTVGSPRSRRRWVNLGCGEGLVTPGAIPRRW